MHLASTIPALRAAASRTDAAPQVPRDLAAGLLRNFLTALEADGLRRDAFMEYARRRAEAQLALWGCGR